MYDLQIEELLSHFNNDPAQLADAFTTQLNDIVKAQTKREKEFKDAFNNYIESLNNLIDKYINYYRPSLAKYSDGFKINLETIDPKDILNYLHTVFDEAEVLMNNDDFVKTIQDYLSS